MACSAVVIELPNGRIHDDDALGGGGRDIDIVDADAGAADHLQVLGIGQNLRRHLGGRADGEAVVIADDLGELVLVLAEIGLEIDLDAAILEDLHGGFGESVGDENFGHGDFSPVISAWSGESPAGPGEGIAKCE